jgi:hypothetical protein
MGRLSGLAFSRHLLHACACYAAGRLRWHGHIAITTTCTAIEAHMLQLPAPPACSLQHHRCQTADLLAPCPLPMPQWAVQSMLVQQYGGTGVRVLDMLAMYERAVASEEEAAAGGQPPVVTWDHCELLYLLRCLEVSGWLK